MRRRAWTEQVVENVMKEEDILISLVEQAERKNRKIRWAQIALKLQIQHPGANRNRKICRSRWLNIVKKRMQFDASNHEHLLNNIQFFYTLLKQHKKQWRMITPYFPAETQKSIQNFVHYSLKKGLEKLNSFNQYIKKPRSYTSFGNPLIKKLIATWECDQNMVEDKKIFRMTFKILQNIIRCSLEQPVEKVRDMMSEEAKLLFFTLGKDIHTALKLWKFKKTKSSTMKVNIS